MEYEDVFLRMLQEARARLAAIASMGKQGQKKKQKIRREEETDDDSGYEFVPVKQPQAMQQDQGSSSPGFSFSSIFDKLGSGSTASGAEAPEVVGNAGEVVGSGTGGSEYLSYAAPYAYILAAIMGQHLASSNTDRRAGKGWDVSKNSGHRTGDVFSGDFFTEPWQPWLYQQLGIDKLTPGERFDAAVDRGDVKGAIAAAPSTGAQWFNPVGSVAYDLAEDKLGEPGKWFARAVLPEQWLGRLFADLF